MIIPRTAGVSCSSTVWWRRRRPRPRTVARWDCLVPITLLTSVTFTFLSDMTYPWISSTVLPRLAAITEGALVAMRPFSVARTTLYGFVEPIDFAMMSVTPITSKTARIAPPAMMPVPSEAGFSMTRPAPKRPSTS